MNEEDFVIVLVTAGSAEEAESIAAHLVEEKLAACINILRECTSIYSWKGKVEKQDEVLMMVKTARSLFSSLARRIQELHSYEVPEIISVSPNDISEAYLEYLISTFGEQTDPMI